VQDSPIRHCMPLILFHLHLRHHKIRHQSLYAMQYDLCGQIKESTHVRVVGLPVHRVHYVRVASRVDVIAVIQRGCLLACGLVVHTHHPVGACKDTSQAQLSKEASRARGVLFSGSAFLLCTHAACHLATLSRTSNQTARMVNRCSYNSGRRFLGQVRSLLSIFSVDICARAVCKWAVHRLPVSRQDV